MKKQALALIAFISCSIQAFAANPMVELKTSLGDIVVELNAEKAPKSSANFVQYVQDGHYDHTVFHRVIDGFMIQGGGFDAKMTQKPTRAPIENEAKNGLKNLPGTLAMARTADPHSASAQFFINLVPNTFLDYPSRDGWGYAVFGKVVRGMDVVEKIAKVKTANAGMHQNVPVEPVTIESARVLDAVPAPSK
ncbi:MAG: peptidylprolyl isomerase [Azoarcus sp.]|jgi:peptidyl-prolyl cis-trans isomerase A (cyclophilin A)|nr:peptidylprolyl isomerase [Azoarcus sp.]MDD2874402.1 peptidylprolyl isomerase [Azoarcus sp.]MDX9836729.1 peptidylprolyl isomerase [Azoarcus sp.]